MLQGHFLLSSGRHSDVFVQKFRIFERPALTIALGAALAAADPTGFDVVASPAVGAIPLGFAVALAAEARFVFAERSGERLAFRRGFSLAATERVRVIEDVVTTGGSAREVCELVKGSGAELTGVGALIDRSERGSSLELPAPLSALLRIDAPSWDASLCPLCERGEPLLDPGSRRRARSG